jgi:vacuolar iron transporter family protein
VAKELTAHNVFAAHVDVELGIDPDDLTNPWQAALSSAVSFTLGALLPLIAMLAPPVVARIPVTFAAVLLALAPTGTISARLGGADPRRALLRIVVGEAIAMMVTYRIGQPLGVAGV